MNRLQLHFKIADTEQEAKEFCDQKNRTATYYCRKKHPAGYTPWSARDGGETGYVCWYHC